MRSNVRCRLISRGAAALAWRALQSRPDLMLPIYRATSEIMRFLISFRKYWSCTTEPDSRSLAYHSDQTIRARCDSRIKESFDQFYDVQAQADSKAAELIKNLEVDIAIDLNNYTEMSRPGILAYRPAPIQASYLEYPATMGATFIDYAIVDNFVLPQEQQTFWPEKFVFMPDSYLAHDTVSKRRMPLRPPTRKEAGLPDEAFVFCCFNSAFKITPSVFEVWMRLLKATEGSVAWFSSAENRPLKFTDRCQCARVDPDGYCCTEGGHRMEDHLSRHRVADLFLDTPL